MIHGGIGFQVTHLCVPQHTLTLKGIRCPNVRGVIDVVGGSSLGLQTDAQPRLKLRQHLRNQSPCVLAKLLLRDLDR